MLFKEQEKLKPGLIDNYIKVVGSRSHMNDDTMNLIEKLNLNYDNVEIVSKGSSLKFC